MKITYIYPDNPVFWASNMWRCQTPARMINRNGRHAAELVSYGEFISKSPRANRICEHSDLLVLYDHLWGNVLPVVQHWMARGKKFIADFDMAYQFLLPSDPDYQTWADGHIETQDDAGSVALKQFKWGLQMVSAATVPSQLLADDWKGYNRVEVIPNYIDLDRYQSFLPKEHEGINIGWSGGQSSLKALSESGALEAVREVCRICPKVKFLLCSDEPDLVHRLGLDENQTIVHALRRGENWPGLLSLFDIGLGPLAGEYDQRRSWAPILEYLVTKIPWVASKGAAYRDLRSCGWFVENDAGAWMRILMDLVEHLDDYKFEAGQSPYLFGLGQSSEENLHQLIYTYAKIMEYSQDKVSLSATGLDN